MKAIGILLTIALCLSTSSIEAASMTAGVKGGLNLSRTYGDDDPGVNIKMLPGFTAGGFIQLKFNKYLAVQPEILFSGKGKKSELIIWKYQFYYSYLFQQEKSFHHWSMQALPSALNWDFPEKRMHSEKKLSIRKPILN